MPDPLATLTDRLYADFLLPSLRCPSGADTHVVPQRPDRPGFSWASLPPRRLPAGCWCAPDLAGWVLGVGVCR